MILHETIVDSLCLRSLDARSGRLLAEGVDPSGVPLVLPRDNVVLAPILEVLLAQLETALYFDLLHATVFRFPLYVIGRLEQSLMRVVLLDC